MKPKLEIYRTIVPPYVWRHVETYLTSDGIRTRVADGHWVSEDKAIKAWEEKMRKVEESQ